MGKIHLNALNALTTAPASGDNENDSLTCPRCRSDETLGFASDGDRHHCRRCLLFFQTRQGDMAGHGRHLKSGPAMSYR